MPIAPIFKEIGQYGLYMFNIDHGRQLAGDSADRHTHINRIHGWLPQEYQLRDNVSHVVVP